MLVCPPHTPQLSIGNAAIPRRKSRVPKRGGLMTQSIVVPFSSRNRCACPNVRTQPHNETRTPTQQNPNSFPFRQRQSHISVESASGQITKQTRSTFASDENVS
ncbi:unnamed protein product [Ectocarpus sp. 4 AP-2014]